MDYIINFGGFDATKTYRSYDTIDVFKVDENGVEKVDFGLSLSEPRHDTVSATLGDFTIVMGGTSGFDVTDAIDIFKTTKNGVIKVENHGLKLSVARTDLAAAAAGSYILAMGGDSGSYSDAVDVFRVTANGVEKVDDHGLALSVGRGVFTAASAGNFILAIGGMIKSNVYSDAVDVFRVTSDGVEQVDDHGLALSEPRAFLSSAAIGNYILVLGGSAGSSVHYKSVEVFEVKNGEVRKLDNHGLELSVGRNVLATAVVDDYVFAMGGFDGTNALDTVDIFKVTNGNFEIVKNHGLSLKQARAYLSAASAGNCVLAMGGIVARDENNKSIPTNAVDVFYNYD